MTEQPEGGTSGSSNGGVSTTLLGSEEGAVLGIRTLELVDVTASPGRQKHTIFGHSPPPPAEPLELSAARSLLRSFRPEWVSVRMSPGGPPSMLMHGGVGAVRGGGRAVCAHRGIGRGEESGWVAWVYISKLTITYT